MHDEQARFRAARSIFLEAREMDDAARQALFAERAPDDPALRGLVERLLASDVAADKFMETVSLRQLPPLPPAEPMPDVVGRTIGGFAVDAPIGRGGMGVVYRARQQDPSRDVALKIVSPAAATSRGVQRFELEKEVLGRLNHPNIARIYGAGVHETSDGWRLPYYAMELIDGQPINAYVGDRKLSADERVRLFIDVCDAVHHAHLKGVIHRDLTPANILVDAAGRPRILDFGLARLAEKDEAPARVRTVTGEIFGTIRYMSPEQASGRTGDIDARTDVYALGAILFELLCGELPHDLQGLSDFDALRRIADDPPRRLAKIDPRLRGDLDTITATCLTHEPQRRYASASALADDLRRYLDDRPISARPPSVWYQLSKFGRRNRGLTIVIAAAALVVAAAAVGVSVISIRLASSNASLQAVRVSHLSSWTRQSRQAADWPTLLGATEEALALATDTADFDRLRLEALWHTSDTWSAFTAELDALEGTERGEACRGDLLLWRAHAPDLEPGEVRRLARAAIDAGLPAGEAAYARAFLAGTVPETVDALHAAVRRDMFNLRARSRLQLGLMLLDRYGEAETAFWSWFARDPVNQRIEAERAVLAAARQRLDEAEQILGQLPPPRTPRDDDWRRRIEAAIELHRSFEHLEQTALLAADIGWFMPLIGPSSSVLVLSGSGLDTESSIPAFADAVSAIGDLHQAVSTQRPEIAVVEEAFRIMPCHRLALIHMMALDSQPEKRREVWARVREWDGPVRVKRMMAFNAMLVAISNVVAFGPQPRDHPPAEPARERLQAACLELLDLRPENPGFIAQAVWGAAMSDSLALDEGIGWWDRFECYDRETHLANTRLMATWHGADTAAVLCAASGLRCSPGDAEFLAIRDAEFRAALERSWPFETELLERLRKAGMLPEELFARPDDPAAPAGAAGEP